MNNNGSESLVGRAARPRARGHRAEALRQFAINFRRARVATLVYREGLGRGQQARIARALGVSTTTIRRDVAVLLALVAPCPYCGSYPLLSGSLHDPVIAAASGAGDDGLPPQYSNPEFHRHRPGGQYPRHAHLHQPNE